MAIKVKKKKEEEQEKNDEIVIEEEESIGSTMEKVYDQLASDKEEEDDALQEREIEEEAPEEEVDEQGESQAEEELQGEEDEDEVEHEEEDEDEEDDIAATSIEAPNTWGDEAKEEFTSLPSKQQEQIVGAYKGMQADYTRKMQGIGDVVNALHPIQKECVQNGITFGDAVRRMVGAHTQLLENPAQAVRGIMQAYGVSPEQVLGVESKDDELPQKAQDRIAALESQMNNTMQGFQEQQNASINAEVEEFAKNNEFFKEVENEMGMLVNSFSSTGQPIPPLKDLYDRACWSNPDVRKKLMAKQSEDKTKESIEERKKRVAKSKRASRVGKKKAAPSTEETGPKSLRDVLSAEYDAEVERSSKRAAG